MYKSIYELVFLCFAYVVCHCCYQCVASPAVVTTLCMPKTHINTYYYSFYKEGSLREKVWLACLDIRISQ